MGIISRLKRRYIIFTKLIEQGNEIETYFSMAAHAGIGLNVVHWGYVEHMLDMLIIWHNHTTNSPTLQPHPRALTRKLDYLKLIEKDVSLSEKDRSSIREIRLVVSEISERRHDFTHSFMDIEHTHTSWKFNRFQYDGPEVRLIRKTYDLDKLAALTEEIRVLVGKISPITEALALEWMKRNVHLFADSATK